MNYSTAEWRKYIAGGQFNINHLFHILKGTTIQINESGPFREFDPAIEELGVPDNINCCHILLVKNTQALWFISLYYSSPSRVPAVNGHSFCSIND